MEGGVIEFVDQRPSDANYLARMTKAELIEFADIKMMSRRQVLEIARRVRKRMRKDRELRR